MATTTAELREPLLPSSSASDSSKDTLDSHNDNSNVDCWDRVCLLVVLPALLGLQFAMALGQQQQSHNASETSTPPNSSIDATATSPWDVGAVIGLFIGAVIGHVAVIGVFIAAAYLYKQCLLLETTSSSGDHESAVAPPAKASSSLQRPALVYLLPEIMVDVILALVLFASVDAALTALMVCTLTLCALVVALETRQLWVSWNSSATLDPQNDDNNNNDSNNSGVNCWDSVCLLVVLPGLMGLQFVMALRQQQRQHETTTSTMNPSPWDVGASIGLFITTAYLYKQCLAKASSSSSLQRPALVYLLPEIMVDVVLALVLFASVDVALTALLVCTLALYTVVILSAARKLWCSSNSSSAGHCCRDDDADDKDESNKQETAELIAV